VRVSCPTAPGAVGQLPPDSGSDDDGEPDQEETGAVPAMLGVEFASGAADLADACTDQMGKAQPGR
jgi:hypothetical protein